MRFKNQSSEEKKSKSESLVPIYLQVELLYNANYVIFF